VHSGGAFYGFSYRLRGLAAGASLSLVLSLVGLVCWDNKVLVWNSLFNHLVLVVFLTSWLVVALGMVAG
jgi:hypothetical protein